MFVDADDFIPNNSLEYMYNIATKTKCDVVCGNVRDKEDKEENKYNSIFISRDEIKELIEKMISNQKFKCDINVMGFACGKLYKKSILNNCFFDEEIRFKEDTLFNIRVFQNATKIAFLDKTCYIYKTNKSSSSFRFFNNYLDEIKIFFEILNNSIKISNFDYQTIKICGLYMYMNYMKHYAMHKELKKESHLHVIRDTFKDDFWKDFFRYSDRNILPLKYKLLIGLYNMKLDLGIYIMCKINEMKVIV